MSEKFLPPNITETTPAGMARQLKDYLCALADQLNRWADTPAPQGREDTQSLYNRLKIPIMQSWDIARAVGKKLENGGLPKGVKVYCVVAGVEGKVSLQTRFSAIAPNGDRRQVFFFCGSCGGEPVQASAVVYEDGTVFCQNALIAEFTQKGELILSLAEQDVLLVFTYLEE